MIRLQPPIEPAPPCRREPLFAWFEWAFLGAVAAVVVFIWRCI